MTQATAATTGRKAIFVDGPSANRTKHTLGIPMVNFGALYTLFVNDVGRCRSLAFRAVITVHPDRASPNSRFMKQLRGAGFDVAPVVSQDEADDDYIKDRIEALDPTVVSEIVLFSSDRDFAPVLRAKASQGISIYWVATKKPRPGETRCGLSEDILRMFDSGEFHFIDLEPYAKRITSVALGPRACTPACPMASDSITEISLTLNNGNPREHQRLMSELQRIAATFKGLYVRPIR